MITTLIPLHDRVLVRRVETETVSAGGIHLVNESQEKPQQGLVISTGTGYLRESGDVTPLNVKEGDSVLFGKYSGSTIKLDGEELLIMKESDIFGILRSEEGGQ